VNRLKSAINFCLAGLFLTALVLPVFAGGGREAGARISLEDALQMVEAGDGFLVDVRGEASYLDQHISGAILIPFNEIVGRTAELAADGRTIITYCDCPAEESSLGAAAKLVAAGVTNVYALDGGIRAWAEAGLPLKRGSRP